MAAWRQGRRSTDPHDDTPQRRDITPKRVRRERDRSLIHGIFAVHHRITFQRRRRVARPFKQSPERDIQQRRSRNDRRREFLASFDRLVDLETVPVLIAVSENVCGGEIEREDVMARFAALPHQSRAHEVRDRPEKQDRKHRQSH